jgi:hypothetical protein
MTGHKDLDSGESNHDLDPLDGKVCEFDWDGLSRALGEPGALAEDDIERLGQALRSILVWVLAGEGGRLNPDDRRAGRRVIALAWVIDPSIIEGSPSLSSLAKQIGTNKAVLSLSSSKVSKVFGISNRAQSHAWNRKPRRGSTPSP